MNGGVKKYLNTETENNSTDVNIGNYDIETNSINWSSYAFFNTSQSTSGLSMSTLQEYVKYPMIYNVILREISKQAYNANGQYARAIDTRVAIPLLSYILVSRDKKKKEQNKKQKAKINLMLKLLNHDKTTRDILRKLDIDGMYVGILRDTKASNKDVIPMSGIVESIDRIEGLSLDDNFMIQPLDNDYVKIVGFQNNVAIAAFDMQYFDQFKYGGLVNEIKNFPKDFMKAYMQYKKDISKRWHILDYKTTIALTARASIDEPYGRPYGLASLADIKFQSDYAESQYKIVSELASSIYVLLLPQGEKMGTCALNKNQQDAVIAAFKGAVRVNTSSNTAKISTISLPPNTKIEKVDKDASLLQDTLNDEIIKKISTSLGFASSALNAASEGSSGFAGLQINIDIISAQVFQMIGMIDDEYTRVLNEVYNEKSNVNTNVKPSNYVDIRYLPISYLNKDDMYEKMKALFTNAGGSRTYMIAAAGIDPYDYLAVCDEEIDEDMDNKYLPHITSYTASDSGDKQNPDDNLGGRPKKKDRNLSFNGAVTKGTGTNDLVKPSTK